MRTSGGGVKFSFEDHESKKVINGPRPSPLMINKDSHVIRKPSVVSSSSCMVATNSNTKQPIIIYTKSPKVIHTKAQDFMSLVQRLTGKPSNSKEEDTSDQNLGSSLSDGSNNNSIKQQRKQVASDHGDETCSDLRKKDDESFCVKVEQQDCPSYSSLGFADMPLFTPTSSDFLYSSRSVYKYSDSPYGILGGLISPSGLEFMKELPEY